MRLTKIDLACNDPAGLAEFYRDVFGLTFVRLDAEFYSGSIGGTEIFLCTKQTAGVPGDAVGLHQFHITVEGEIESMIERAAAYGCRAEEVEYEPGVRQHCIRDVEENPWIVRRNADPS